MVSAVVSSHGVPFLKVMRINAHAVLDCMHSRCTGAAFVVRLCMCGQGVMSIEAVHVHMHAVLVSKECGSALVGCIEARATAHALKLGKGMWSNSSCGMRAVECC